MERTGSKHINAMSDEELIVLARKKNETAFLEIFNRYKGGLKAHIHKVVPSADVEDICMQTFLKAFLHIESFDETKGVFRTWLYTIGWNTALDHSDKIRRENDKMPTTSIDTDASTTAGITTGEASPEDTISTREDYDKIIGYINGLSELYREIARLRFVEEMDYNEIAEKLDMPLNTIKTRIRRSKEILQKMLIEDEEDEL
ncbi:MAG: sigma-70 family RNA polymerase sigma factor [Bacteroidales bacterium]|nr:sigma-70 family RNA polymerase sigma factor [Bacteroidales bacterium]